jgi:hypothetical protein
MTAKELINILEQILEDRGGEDLEVRMDVDFQVSHSICSVAVLPGFGTQEDFVRLCSSDADDACAKHDPRLKIPEKKGLN